MATATNPASAGPEFHAVADLEKLNEGREIERVVARLHERYPTLSQADVRRAVTVAIHAFDGAKVRHFVPLLVERMARESLDHVRRTGQNGPPV
jgi:hypothetical protein